MPMWLIWIVATVIVGFAFYLNYAHGYEAGLRDGLKQADRNDSETNQS